MLNRIGIILFCLMIQWKVKLDYNNHFNKTFNIKVVKVILKEKHVEVWRGIQ